MRMLADAMDAAASGQRVVVYTRHWRQARQLFDTVNQALNSNEAQGIRSVVGRCTIEWSGGGRIIFRNHEDKGSVRELGERIDARFTDHHVYER